MVRAIVHALAAAQFGFAAYYDWIYVKIPGNIPNLGEQFGKKLRYLTYWNCLCQTILFTICLINDVVGSNEVNPKHKPFIRRLRDIFQCSIGFPLAMFVGSTFWILYGIDRELVFPKAIDPYFPVWLNHVMHTNIVIFSLVEHVTSFRTYPSRKTALTILTVFMAAYLGWTFVIYGMSGRWVYPVMEVLNWPMRIVFILAMVVFTWTLYFVGEKVNSSVWGIQLKQLNKPQKKNK